jgi:hypothetical protein
MTEITPAKADKIRRFLKTERQTAVRLAEDRTTSPNQKMFLQRACTSPWQS